MNAQPKALFGLIEGFGKLLSTVSTTPPPVTPIGKVKITLESSGERDTFEASLLHRTFSPQRGPKQLGRRCCFVIDIDGKRQTMNCPAMYSANSLTPRFPNESDGVVPVRLHTDYQVVPANATFAYDEHLAPS